MQTVTLKIKLLPPNKGKTEKMKRMMEPVKPVPGFWSGPSLKHYQPRKVKPGDIPADM